VTLYTLCQPQKIDCSFLSHFLPPDPVRLSSARTEFFYFLFFAINPACFSAKYKSMHIISLNFIIVKR